MDYQNSLENINDVEEGFSAVNKDIALKGLLFAMVFYIVSSPVIIQSIEQYLPKTIETLLVQSILFGIVFYLISINL